MCDPDGRRIHVLDTDRNRCVDTFQIADYHPEIFTVHPRDALLVVECPRVNKVLLISAIDGRPVARIDGLSAAGGVLAFSPDGRWLLVGRGAPEGGVAVVDLQAVLAPPGIAFASNRGGAGYQIFRADLSGRHVTQLTGGSGNDVGPRWAPEGRRIGFLSDRDGPWRICVMGTDGQQVRRTGNN